MGQAGRPGKSVNINMLSVATHKSGDLTALLVYKARRCHFLDDLKLDVERHVTPESHFKLL
jgi:hypothetical protein